MSAEFFYLANGTKVRRGSWINLMEDDVKHKDRERIQRLATAVFPEGLPKSKDGHLGGVEKIAERPEVFVARPQFMSCLRGEHVEEYEDLGFSICTHCRCAFQAR
mgnify:CR=1 FL=1